MREAIAVGRIANISSVLNTYHFIQFLGATLDRETEYLVVDIYWNIWSLQVLK